jgi:PAS domain S-box-containing protein
MANGGAIMLADPGGDLEDFFENGTIGLHLVGSDGTILRANPADYAPLGYTAEEYVGHSITEFHADAEVIADILAKLTAGEKLDKYPARLKAKNGSLRHVLISSSVCFRDGAFVNTRCFTLDVTDKVQAEAALREAQERLAATYESVLAGIAECDADGRFVRVNDAFAAISGFSKEQLLARTFFDITHPEDIAAERRAFAAQVAGDTDRYDCTKRYVRGDGRVIWVEVASSTVRHVDGAFRYAVRMVQDVTERKSAEQHARLLIEELNHRVKNTLAIVQAIASHTARNATSAEDFRQRFEPRLLALSAAHDRLTRTNWRGANLADVVEAALDVHEARSPAIDAGGPDLMLPPKITLSLSMALHELTTNALKYGALAEDRGRVELRWSVGRDAASPYPTALTLVWHEHGGRGVTPPTTHGFGSRLLQVTAAELDGEVRTEWLPTGLRWQLTVPLAASDFQ